MLNLIMNFDPRQKAQFKNENELRRWLQNEDHLDGVTIVAPHPDRGFVYYATARILEDDRDGLPYELDYGIADADTDSRGNLTGLDHWSNHPEFETDAYETAAELIEQVVAFVLNPYHLAQW